MEYKNESVNPYNSTSLAEQFPQHERRYYIPPAEHKAGKGYLIVKRVFDMVFATIVLLLLSVPMLILLGVIAADSPGAPIYKQERLGLHGRTFTILKFRTMRLDAEKDGPKWAEENDERCTSVGRFLRNHRLDELPQLFNIIKGEMSFVGPRPERKCFYDEFEKYIDGFSNRLEAIPGVTGLAQINGGYDLLPEEKIVYDMEYINNRSVRMDAACLFKTVRIILTHNGAR